MSVVNDRQSPINVGDLDRKLSLGLGGLMALSTLAPAPGRLIRLGLGAFFLYHGIGRRDKLYDVLGINTLEGEQQTLKILAPDRGIRIERSVTISRPRQEVYAFWRQLSNLPHFMRHLKSVTSTGDRRSHWVAAAPFEVQWDAEITEEREGELIAWRSVEGSQVNNAGYVRFEDAPANKGTVVNVAIEYSPIGGPAGVAAAKLVQAATATQIRADLGRVKAMLEAGQILSVEGQSSGRAVIEGPQDRERDTGRSHKKDVVIEASEDSFPASDAPGWITRSA
jgi:uncharacterized membrane protein